MRLIALKSGLLAVATVATAQAQLPVNGYAPNADQLLLGFTVGGSTGDLVINLGSPAQVGVGGSATVDLIAHNNVGQSAANLLAQFNTLYGNMNGLQWGVVGAHYRNLTDNAVYMTVPRGAPTPTIGSAQYLSSAADTVGQGLLDFPGKTVNQGVVDPSQNYGESWTEQVVLPNSVWQKNATSPLCTTSNTFSTGGIKYQSADLYTQANGVGSPQAYKGYFTLGNDGSLTFTPASGITIPAVTTLAASAVTTSSATLNASINPNGAATTFAFQYGTNTAYGNTTPVIKLASGTTAVSTNATVTGLQAGKTYHYRVVATNSAGSASGSDLTFTTLATITMPSTTTLAASAITAGTATLNADINPNGAATTFSFQYGTNTAYGSSTPVVTLAAGTTAVSTNATVAGLLAGQTYHYRVVATNSAGFASGSDLTFTTLSATPPQLGSLSYGNSGFQFTFSSPGGGSFTAWGASNLALPFNQWSNLGPATVVAPGQYQFIDPRATNSARRFYRVTQP